MSKYPDCLDVLILKRRIILTYLIRDIKESVPVIGRLVEVPLRNETVLGCVLGISGEKELQKILPIKRFIGRECFLDENGIQLALFMSSYYGYPLDECFMKIFPAGIFSGLKKKISASKNMPKGELGRSGILSALVKKENMNFEYFLEKIKSENNLRLFGELVEKKLFDVSYSLSPPAALKYTERIVSLKETGTSGEKGFEKTLVDFLVSSGNSCELTKIIGVFGENGISAVASLLRKNVLMTRKIQSPSGGFEKFELTPDQKVCFEKIDLNAKGVYLLKGVTGSGKTYVYSKCIEKTLENGKTAVCLVPEIALIPQTVRFFSKFLPGACIMTYHSYMNPKKRFDTFRKARDGGCSLIIGTRSAIFLPLKNTGIIVVDEEHSQHYKEEESGPFYSARDIAVWKGKNLEIPVILGSATPSAESIFNAKKGKYRLIELKKRISETKMPQCVLTPVFKSRKDAISDELKKELEINFNNGQQSVLFINRRGFSHFAVCPACSSVINCRHCNVSMTYHESKEKLVCHYCGKERKLPEKCPVCSHPKIHLHGAGTERIEKELQKILPLTEILRLDTDVVKKTKNGHEDFFRDFHSGRYPVLVGTQMISKGLDFPGVSLVGIIDADSALSFPDFRAQENAFQLIVQTAGRAGRVGQDSKVLIQTCNVSNPVLFFAKNHDYDGFIATELKSRQEVGYPPFTRIARVMIASPSNEKAQNTAKKAKKILQKSLPETEIIGPAPCPLEKIRNSYRWHFLVKAPKNVPLGEKILLSGIWELKKGVKIYVDIDPVRML
ncbi:primosomal protein N' [candidate division WOR-3 bacterium]|nr:primosomal protein N' [candidate division WOR-3 bacterium]